MNKKHKTFFYLQPLHQTLLMNELDGAFALAWWKKKNNAQF